MMELIAAIIPQIVNTLWSHGPLGMAFALALVGWGSTFYMWIKNRGTPAKPKKTEPAVIDYVNDIRKLHDRHLNSLKELNERYSAAMADVNEKRIDDMKSINKQYSELARDILSALDKVVDVLDSNQD